MATNSHFNARGKRRRILALVLLSATALLLSGEPTAQRSGSEGTVTRLKPSSRPTVQAAFTRESYPPGTIARLAVFSAAQSVHVQVFRAGAELGRIAARDEMRGAPVGDIRDIGTVHPGRELSIRVGSWRSGFYFVRLTAARNRVGYAPFIVRPRRLGEHRVAVVLPTFTWQAYNFRDDDGDGDADTWYADTDEKLVRLGRPYENRGVPSHYKHYDQPFLRWLLHTSRAVDYLADSDLHRTGSGRNLARAYELLIFPGHHEYVTTREYDAVVGFRNRGGNLMFLSANNFFWRVDLRGRSIRRVAQWRDLRRPEAALIGVQYFGNDEGTHRGPWLVRGSGAAPWLFAGTNLRDGSSLSSGGIEADSTTRSSPRSVKVLAEIPNIFGTGQSAQMAYYETRSGAKVFAAGAFTLAGSVWQPTVQRLMENLWARLSTDPDRAGRR